MQIKTLYFSLYCYIEIKFEYTEQCALENCLKSLPVNVTNWCYVM